MRRTLATVGTALLLAWPLAGCGDDDDSAGTADAEPAASASATEPALEALPAPAPELPTAPPKALAPEGASFDSCAIVSPDLVTEVFGTGPGQALPQESGLGDPDAVDCYYYGGESLIAVQATTRADQDLPEGSYTYDGIPGAVEVPGADRGWAVIFPGQEGSGSLVSGLIVVKGQLGLNLAISIAGHPYDMDTVLEFADRLLEAM
jgi:hypothetical protein